MVTPNARAPSTVQMSWRSKKYHADPYVVIDRTDDAESTMTIPTTFSTATVAMSSRKWAGRGRADAGARRCVRLGAVAVAISRSPPGC